ncbi:MAG: hypothetical protein HYY24_30035 [Verrucomicrobia bacterium]|nr:hypothetical protein [Verrucomicrobiota bacterium]
MTTQPRFVSPDDLPDTLWRWREKAMCLPPDLVAAWTRLLNRHELRQLAEQPRPEKGPIGGISKEATDQHLAWSFTGSSARVELAMLDAQTSMPDIADALMQVFSGGRVAVADLPCGSGAAILTILTTLAELRRQGRVPREPLEVVITAGEFSEQARAYAAEGIHTVRASLEAQAIWVDPTFLHWDVCDAMSNSDLIREMTLRSQACGARMLVMANFSGFLQREGKWNDARPQFDELFRHSRDENSSVVWIEPQSNEVTHEKGGFFSRLRQWLEKTWARFIQTAQREGERAALAKAEAQVVDALNPKRRFNVHLAVMRLDLRLQR